MTDPHQQMGLPAKTKRFETMDPNEVLLISAMGQEPKPNGRKTIWGTGVYNGGIKLSLARGQVYAAFTIAPEEITLFRHEQASAGDYAYLERSVYLQETDRDEDSSPYQQPSSIMVYVQMTAYIQIRKLEGKDRFLNYIKSYRQCDEHDFRQASEQILNSPLMIFLGDKLNHLQEEDDFKELLKYSANSVDLSQKAKDFLSKISDQDIYDYFDFGFQSSGEYEYLDVKNSASTTAGSQRPDLGKAIMQYLTKIGVSLTQLTIDHVTVPESIRESVNQQVLDEVEITKQRRQENQQLEAENRRKRQEKTNAEWDQEIQAIKNITLKEEMTRLLEIENTTGYSRKEIIDQQMLKEVPNICKLLENAHINLSSDKSIMGQVMNMLYHQNEMSS